MINDIIADKLQSIAALLDLEDKPWESRAYENARDTINDLGRSVADIYDDKGRDGLLDLPNVGETIADNIVEYIETDTIEKLDSLRDAYPEDIETMLSIRGLGPATARQILDELDITSLEALDRAAKQGALQGLDGIGPTTEQNILDGIESLRSRQTQRFLLHTARDVLHDLTPYLEGHDAVNRVKPVGSYRRYKETIGDLDILVETADGEAVSDHVASYKYVDDVDSKGGAKCRFTLRNGVSVDLRYVSRKEWGAAEQYFTGNKDHNIALRRHANDQDYSLSEYGLTDADETTKRFAEEHDVYDALDLQYIPPALRQGRDEIKQAKNQAIPSLVDQTDIRGDLHLHTAWSDGGNTVSEMVEAAEQRGYEYVAITDHSKSSAFAGGLGSVDLRSQQDEIRAVNADHDLTVLAGSEVDILADGGLDYDDAVLEALDVVIVGLHSDLGMDEERMTERVLSALHNEHVTCFAHPSARLINRRDPATMDYDQVFSTAAEQGVAIEINANPNRLDANDAHIRLAKEHGCSFLINTDSHDTASLDLMDYGVGQARRGGLTPADVLNTQPLDDWLR